MKRLAIAAAIAMNGCVAVVHESGQYIDEPADRAVAHLRAGQIITVSLADGSTIQGTYRGSSSGLFVVTTRGTFANEEHRYAFAQVKSVHYYQNNGEWLEPAPAFPFAPARF
ncbi:MAG TPA: hypothetical protein VFB36_08295 [Nevskiaceae bacterium]|nr:hypothetical protein [Nevskiaceae bacterium]